MNEIIPFSYSGRPIRVVRIDGEPWWVVSEPGLYFTPKGEGYAWDRLTAYIEANGTLELPRRIGGVA